jgi:Uma2 family endonuclease
MRQAFQELQLPPGMRAELVDGEIFVSPTPNGNHAAIIAKITRWVLNGFDGMMLYSSITIVSPDGEYVPDGLVAPDGTFDGEEWRFAPRGVALVLEVTSQQATPAERDRGPKRRGYAAAEIPLYLLVDRNDGKVTIFSDPRGGDYHHSASVMIGDKLDIPEPLAGTLDTGEF